MFHPTNLILNRDNFFTFCTLPQTHLISYCTRFQQDLGILLSNLGTQPYRYYDIMSTRILFIQHWSFIKSKETIFLKNLQISMSKNHFLSVEIACFGHPATIPAVNRRGKSASAVGLSMSNRRRKLLVSVYPPSIRAYLHTQGHGGRRRLLQLIDGGSPTVETTQYFLKYLRRLASGCIFDS